MKPDCMEMDHKLVPLDVDEKRMTRDNYLQIWAHYETWGGNDKSRMITAVTWVLALGAAVMAYVATRVTRPDEVFTAACLVGFLLCFFAGFLVITFAGYARRNYCRADKIKREIPHLERVADSVSKSRRGAPPFSDLGSIFSTLFYLCVAGAVAFVALGVVALLAAQSAE